MVTYHELRAADVHTFAALAVEFRLVATRSRDRAETAHELRRRLERHWSGPAARAATDCCDRLRRRLIRLATLAARCDQLLAELSGRLGRARALLAEAQELADTVGVPIGADGSTHPVTAGAAPDLGLVQVCADVDRRICAALRLACEADRVTAEELRELAVRLAGEAAAPGLTGTDADADVPAWPYGVAWPHGYPWPAGLGSPYAVGWPGAVGWSGAVGWPGAAAGPAEVAAFWAGLTRSQRWWLVTHQPALVGGRDGISVADRDTANRLLLDAERGRLLALRTEGDLPMVDLAWVDGQLRGIGAIGERLRDPGMPRAYLLDLSTVDDGRAVIAVGNPDQATDVLTYVPGTGADLSGVDTLVRRADALGAATVELAPQRQVSVIAWLGYDPPDGIGAVMAQPGHDAQPALDAFADGLRATHDGVRSHNTLLGHSYGSLVAGVTARDRGLDADDLIFVGSPGVGVDHAADLGLSPAAVWSSTAANDPIQRFAPGWGQLALVVAQNAISPMSASYGDARPDLLLWHGLNPSTPAFGGNVFASDPDGGHTGYWRGSALANIARIALDLNPDPPP